MPIMETPNTITVGKICMSCGLLATATCPYKNHVRYSQGQSPLFFKGDNRGKCCYYQPIQQAGDSTSMQKTAKNMRDSEINVELYKKIMALKDEDRKKLFDYWDYLYPSEYAKEMVTDENETKQRDLKKQPTLPSKTKKKDNKDKKERSTKFPEPFKS